MAEKHTADPARRMIQGELAVDVAELECATAFGQ